MKHKAVYFLGIIFLLFISFFVFFQRPKPVLVSPKVLLKDTCDRKLITEFSVMDPAFYQGETIPPKILEEKILGGIVNHHLLAKEFVDEVLVTLKEQQPKRIVLISPNHFNQGAGDIQTADLLWRSPVGEVKTPCGILQEGIVSNEPLTFLGEHGVSNIIPFIKKYLPDTEVLPLVVKEKTDFASLDAVAESLASLEDTIFLGSFDFSHELPPLVSEFRDQKSLDVITSFDLAGTDNIAVDSKRGLYLLLKVLEKKGAQNFSLFRNSNSGFLIKEDITDATSYITGVFERGLPKVQSVANILFFGDMMLDRNVAKRMLEYGDDYPFSNIKHLLQGNDIVGANLEGVFTENDSIAQKNNKILRFTFNPDFVKELKQLGFTVFSQANNHTNDFGRNGLNDSFINLEAEGVKHFGSYFNDEHISDVILQNGQRIAFVGFNDFAYKNYEVVLEEIKKIQEDSDFVIVVPHWGDEYQVVSNTKQKKLAREFVDAGADMVIGAHPHVVQDVDIYKDKLIFYSLGNFVFDQDFSKETTEGLGVGLSLEKNSLRAYLIPFDVKQSQVVLKSGEAVTEFLRRIASVSSKDLQEQILKGKIEVYEK